MGMATFTDNTEQIAAEFQSLKNVFDRVTMNQMGNAVAGNN